MRRKRVVAPVYSMTAAITKAELMEAARQYGAANAVPVAGYPPETLRLRTFVGKWDAGRKRFVGAYEFDGLTGEIDQTFQDLPGLMPWRGVVDRIQAAAPGPASDEVTDG